MSHWMGGCVIGSIIGVIAAAIIIYGATHKCVVRERVAHKKVSNDAPVIDFSKIATGSNNVFFVDANPDGAEAMTKKPVFDTASDMAKEMGLDVQKAAVDSVCRSAIRRVAEARDVEAVDAGISVIQDEFLAQIVLSDGRTVGETIQTARARLIVTIENPVPGGTRPNQGTISMLDTLPPIGAAFGGGYLAALMPAPEGQLYALIVAPKAEGQKDDVKWKTSYTKTECAASYVDGLANSEAMNNAKHPAAQFCRSLTIGGFDDWHLPASAEQAAIWANLGPNHTPVAAFQKGAAEAFDDRWYWSSTECGSDCAWFQGFGDGYQDGDLKGYEGRCRAVRKLILI